VLHETKIHQLIDESVANISDAVNRQQQVWNIDINLGGRIANMKNFVSQRIQWISNQLNSNTLDCENVTIPHLVISKIHYHPKDQEDDDSDDFEFVEITNNSDVEWDLTGVYFGGLGFSYQFPKGYFIQARESVFLANKPSAFESTYGFTPFDEFFRNLSNSSERLELLDGFGNQIDLVVYNDYTPWPEDADGEGYYLKLIDLDFDNSLAENWIASSSAEDLLSFGNTDGLQISVYPNSTQDLIYITAIGDEIKSIEILNLSGQRVITKSFSINQNSLDISELSTGIYFIQVELTKQMFTKKIIKE
jgi:hypothetical protein